jgi:hypothetical protein
MIHEPSEWEGDPAEQQRQVDLIVARGPSGTFAVAGLATAIVLAIWLVFYVGVFVARGGGN